MDETAATARRYVILGASGGIGVELARLLHRQGDALCLASRASDRLQALGDELGVPTIVLDASRLDEVEACFTRAGEKMGGIDGAVNCVGSMLLKPAHLTRATEWDTTIATNLTTAFATVRAAGKTMTKNGGSVVLMSSAAARIGLASHEAIAAAKAGVVGLAKSAAASYAGRGLRFNVVAPGLVRTKLTEKIWGNERAAASSTAMHALGRFGEPGEIASLIAWLLSPSNSWLTGEVFSIDGGLSTLKLMSRS